MTRDSFYAGKVGTPVCCAVCGETHRHGIDAISDGDESGICAWCHFGEFGYWPTGMTQEYGDDDADFMGLR